MIQSCDFSHQHMTLTEHFPKLAHTVDGRNPKQPPGMYESLHMMV